MKKIFIAGHNGMVGSAICRKLKHTPNVKIIVKSKKELDLRDQRSVSKFFIEEKPDEVILLALQKLAAYTLITHTQQILFMITYRFKIILSTLHI